MFRVQTRAWRVLLGIHSCPTSLGKYSNYTMEKRVRVVRTTICSQYNAPAIACHIAVIFCIKICCHIAHKKCQNTNWKKSPNLLQSVVWLFGKFNAHQISRYIACPLCYQHIYKNANKLADHMHGSHTPLREVDTLHSHSGAKAWSVTWKREP